MFIHMHKHIHISAHVYIYTYMYVYTYIHTYIHTYSHAYTIHSYIHAYTHTNIHPYIHPYTHTYIHPWPNIHTLTHTLISYIHVCGKVGSGANEPPAIENAYQLVEMLAQLGALPVERDVPMREVRHQLCKTHSVGRAPVVADRLR